MKQNYEEIDALRRRFGIRPLEDKSNHNNYHFKDQHDWREGFDSYNHNQLDLRMPHEPHHYRYPMDNQPKSNYYDN